MKRTIIFGAHRIDYAIKKHRRVKHLRLSVYPGGRVVLTLPWWASARAGHKFVADKAEWILAKIKHQANHTKAWPIKIDKQEYQAYKEQALKFVSERLIHFNQAYNFKIKRISIKKPATRWGSCSRLGNLNFNYRLLWLPPALADYIIVHELCHLGELNHSPKFWRLVEQILPNYKALRRELKK
jgi:predicted metal-dependent hydrolase